MNNNSPTKILILDACQRSALAATRSLGAFAHLYVVTSDTVEHTLAGSSRFSEQHFTYPDPVKKPDDFVRSVARFCCSEGISFIQPMTEITSQLIAINHKQFGSTIIPFSGIEIIRSIANKTSLMLLANSLSIPIPSTQYYASLKEWDYNKETDFPIVVKPSLSRFEHNGEWITTTVRIVKSAQELSSIISKDNYLKYTSFMVQEYIPGHGAGIFALYRNGRRKAHFAHRRIREKPPSGGVSVLSESVAASPTLISYADAMLEKVRWSGVAMVEFRISDEGTPYLMEINTRFWGSLQLAIDSGVDFPLLTYQAFTGSTNTSGEYRVGLKLRWLLGDFDSLYLYLRDARYTKMQKFQRLAVFFTPSFNCKNEIFRLRDIQPAWHELGNYIKNIFVK